MTALTGELLIGAARVSATAGTMRALNPTTGEFLEPEFAFGGQEEVDRALRLADEAFDSYSHTGLAERAAFLDLVAD
ncbi:aldehyde dehydrogenase family protein, partial [Streptomyces sp. NPDC001982]